MNRIVTICLGLLHLTMHAEPLPEPVRQIVDRAAFGANNELLLAPKAKIVLNEFCRSSWRSLLQNVSDEKTPAREREVLIQACVQGLPDSEYLPFVAESFRHIALGTFPPSVATRLLYPAAGKEGFLPVNYDNAELAGALRAALPLFSDPDDKAFAQKILSGAAKQEYLKWTADQGLQARPPVTTAAVNPIPDPAAPTPAVATPTSSTPVPTATPVASTRAPKVAESPALLIERKSLVWPWLVGILALVVIVAVALKRRA